MNKVIGLTSLTIKSGPYGNIAKIQDEKGLTYSVFEKKRDNTTSVAWQQLMGYTDDNGEDHEGLKLGTNVQISFSEEQKEYEGKSYTARTIRSFNEDIGNGAANYANQSPSTPSSPASNLDHSGAPQRGSNDAFGRRLAIHGMVNGMLAAGVRPEQINTTAIKNLLELEDRLESALSPVSEPTATEPSFIRSPGDFNTEDIPF